MAVARKTRAMMRQRTPETRDGAATSGIEAILNRRRRGVRIRRLPHDEAAIHADLPASADHLTLDSVEQELRSLQALFRDGLLHGGERRHREGGKRDVVKAG